jgi:hypothetical protein
MVTLDALWLPILVATVLVFVWSNLVWMVLPHHKADTRRLPDEAAVVEALRKQALSPAIYRYPWADSMKEMGEPAFVAKLEKGPVGMITVLPNGNMNMGKMMGTWVAYIAILSIVVAYVAGRTLAAGTPYLSVFRLTGTVAFLAYAAANVPNAIWWGKPWGNTWREVFDGLCYGLLTAGAFAWLWPR